MSGVFVADPDVTLYHGDALEVLRGMADGSVDACVTSPPYWGLRDYGTEGQLGLEGTPDEYVAAMVAVFREVRRVLAPHGTCWLNLGDSYVSNGWWPDAPSSQNDSISRGDKRREMGGRGITKAPGLKAKDLCGIPWRVAFALQADGWFLRSDIIWSKPNPMPESVRDRPTKSHEYVFLLTKSSRYFFDQEAVREPLLPASVERGRYGHASFGKGQFNGSPIDGRHQAGKQVAAVADLQNASGRNVRSVWTIATQPYPEAHFAVFPEELPRRCILAGCPEGGTVLDPFAGSGTTLLVARKHSRNAVGIELNGSYCQLAARRLQQLSLLAEIA